MRADGLIGPQLKRLLLRGRWYVGVAGALRQEAFALRDRMTEELELVDREIAALVEERIELTRWLARIRDALKPPGYGGRSRYPLPHDADGAPGSTVELRGSALRDALRSLLQASPGPLRVAELRRALLARGASAPGNAGKSISDALRAELRRGAVVRTGRGEYLAADKMSRWHQERVQASSPTLGAGPTHPRSQSTAPLGRIAS